MALHADATATPLGTLNPTQGECESSPSTLFHVITYYGFAPIADPHALKETLKTYGQQQGLLGTTLLATEGVNGTMSGEPDAVEGYIALMEREVPGLTLKRMTTTNPYKPFNKLYVVVKNEVVTFREPGLEANPASTSHVSPDEWNRILNEEGTVTLDVRNDFEVHIGSFNGAENPLTDKFTDFKAFVAENFARLKHAKRVAMFCTGGIRCEKASVYLEELGITNIAQLDGGILNYLQTIPQENSLWEGECFVFDQRVTLTHDLQQGHYCLEKGKVKRQANGDATVPSSQVPIGPQY